MSGTHYTETKALHFTAQAADFQALDAEPTLSLVAYELEETAGAAAQVRLRHGATDSAPILRTVSVAANTEVADSAVPQGGRLQVPDGLFVEVVAGTVSMTAFYTAGGEQAPTAAD